MAAVSLFWDTIMAAVMSCENTLIDGWIHLQHTGVAVALVYWNFYLFFSLKTIKKRRDKQKFCRWRATLLYE